MSVKGRTYAGMETTSISDPSCPGDEILLSVADDVYRHKDIAAFAKGIRLHGMGAVATVIGRFHTKAPVHPFPMPAIELHAVRDVVFGTK